MRRALPLPKQKTKMLLATGSADRIVRFWDLDTFALVAAAGYDMLKHYIM